MEIEDLSSVGSPYENLHKLRGCKGCKFADKQKLFKDRCCTFAFKLEIDSETGKCLTRREK